MKNTSAVSGENAPGRLTARDFASDQRVKWCPGCGCFSVLAQLQKTMAAQGLPREKYVVVSGIGCSSRFPYYMNTYGFHTLHGRAPAVASGVKLANPELSVWVMTGDGDGLSIGGNHLFHALRRNMGLKIVLFNNRIYGLTKGQASPTSRQGVKTKSSPFGTVDKPVNPISFALGAGATFVARSVISEPAHLQGLLEKASRHEGSAFIEVYQDCVVFTDGEFSQVIESEVREENILKLEHGKPLVFGKSKNKGIKMNGFSPEITEFAAGGIPEEIVRHDEKTPELAFLLSRMILPDFPVPIGVFRQVEEPSHEKKMHDLIRAVSKPGQDTLEHLLHGPDTWEIRK